MDGFLWVLEFVNKELTYKETPGSVGDKLIVIFLSSLFRHSYGLKLANETWS